MVPDGRLLLVEPDGRTGLTALVADTLWARTRWVAGFHVGRDITASVRSTTFSLDDIERFTMPTAVSSLRTAVEVHALRVAVPEPSGHLPVGATT